MTSRGKEDLGGVGACGSLGEDPGESKPVSIPACRPIMYISLSETKQNSWCGVNHRYRGVRNNRRTVKQRGRGVRATTPHPLSGEKRGMNAALSEN